MNHGRFVVLGLAQTRSQWFRSVAQWANSGSLAVEFVKCVSLVEVRAHLASARAFSALLVDAGCPAVDRDLFALARDAGCAVIVVDNVRVSRDWAALGASTVMNPVFERADLLETLRSHAVEITRADVVPGEPEDNPPAGWRAKVAMVCGSGGTGVSTAAIALAQGLGDDPSLGRMVLLCDFALHAEQAMLHDARDVVPGVQELVELHRAGRPTIEELRALMFEIEERRYQLLLGLRRSRNWASIRPRAFDAAVDSITRGWRAIVCDTGAELEGEADGGSADIEERNTMARTVAAWAHVVFAVGLPTMKGLHSLVRVIGDLLDHDVAADRIVPVVNCAPRGPRGRAEIAALIPALLQRRSDASALASPTFLPTRNVDDALRDGVRLHASLTTPLVDAFETIVRRTAAPSPGSGFERVRPGSLGQWSSDSSAEPA